MANNESAIDECIDEINAMTNEQIDRVYDDIEGIVQSLKDLDDELAEVIDSIDNLDWYTGNHELFFDVVNQYPDRVEVGQYRDGVLDDLNGAQELLDAVRNRQEELN